MGIGLDQQQGEPHEKKREVRERDRERVGCAHRGRDGERQQVL